MPKVPPASPAQPTPKNLCQLIIDNDASGVQILLDNGADVNAKVL